MDVKSDGRKVRNEGLCHRQAQQTLRKETWRNPRVLVVWWRSGGQSISRPFVLSALVISEWETR